eukprot:2701155-Lingulodinium_polyedra.AAC.1
MISQIVRRSVGEVVNLPSGVRPFYREIGSEWRLMNNFNGASAVVQGQGLAMQASALFDEASAMLVMR